MAAKSSSVHSTGGSRGGGAREGGRVHGRACGMSVRYAVAEQHHRSSKSKPKSISLRPARSMVSRRRRHSGYAEGRSRCLPAHGLPRWRRLLSEPDRRGVDAAGDMHRQRARLRIMLVHEAAELGDMAGFEHVRISRPSMRAKCSCQACGIVSFGEALLFADREEALRSSPRKKA